MGPKVQTKLREAFLLPVGCSIPEWASCLLNRRHQHQFPYPTFTSSTDRPVQQAWFFFWGLIFFPQPHSPADSRIMFCSQVKDGLTYVLAHLGRYWRGPCLCSWVSSGVCSPPTCCLPWGLSKTEEAYPSANSTSFPEAFPRAFPRDKNSMVLRKIIRFFMGFCHLISSLTCEMNPRVEVKTREAD